MCWWARAAVSAHTCGARAHPVLFTPITHDGTRAVMFTPLNGGRTAPLNLMWHTPAPEPTTPSNVGGTCNADAWTKSAAAQPGYSRHAPQHSCGDATVLANNNGKSEDEDEDQEEEEEEEEDSEEDAQEDAKEEEKKRKKKKGKNNNQEEKEKKKKKEKRKKQKKRTRKKK